MVSRDNILRETLYAVYPVRDIAAMQEAPVGSIKRRLHDDARRKLKEVTLEMVEDTVKAKAPKEDFVRRVSDRYPCYCVLPAPVKPRAMWV